MEKQEITNPIIDWASLVRHVAKDQVRIELADGSDPIAEVIPKKKPVWIKDFASIMSSLPPLGEDADAFARDIEEMRANFKDDSSPWES